jgi:hypothetical protein
MFNIGITVLIILVFSIVLFVPICICIIYCFCKMVMHWWQELDSSIGTVNDEPYYVDDAPKPMSETDKAHERMGI